MTQQSETGNSELQILEAIEKSPETTQADLARVVGVAVGTVNWHLKRWSRKGYVKISRINRWNWSYLLTAEGIAHKAKLASEYLEISLSLYRKTREEAKRLLEEVKAAGYDSVFVDGDGEIAEIVRLTCLEMGVACQALHDGRALKVRIEQTRLSLELPQENVER
jgi:DNA-binding MarR family transcriptional regulator